jgi:hypothetical protein
VGTGVLGRVVGSRISRGISKSGFRWISNGISNGISKLENGRFMTNPCKSHIKEVSLIQGDSHLQRRSHDQRRCFYVDTHVDTT